MKNKGVQMKKPTLKDFGLTEELLQKYENQKKEVQHLLQNEIYKRNNRYKNVFIIFALISFLFLIIAIATDFCEFSRIMLGLSVLCAFWCLAIWFPLRKDNIEDVDENKRREIERRIIDEDLDKAIFNYKIAMLEYGDMLKVNEFSLVHVEYCRVVSQTNLLSMWDEWIVFSNMYLENADSYPDLKTEDMASIEFEEYYRQLIEKQKNTAPKPKKEFSFINGELLFYYPCSNLFAEMEGKKEGDYVKISPEEVYEILEVINCDN